VLLGGADGNVLTRPRGCSNKTFDTYTYTTHRFIHNVRVLLGGADGDVLLLGVVDQVEAALELVEVGAVTPQRDALHVGGHGEVAELEADLVVALPCGPVRHVFGALAAADLDLALADAGAGDGGAEEIAALVDGVGTDNLEVRMEMRGGGVREGASKRHVEPWKRGFTQRHTGI
jgi:hypothetical protein